MKRKDRGSIVVESLLLVPVLMMLVLLVVYVGRWTTSAHRVHRAADVGARAASQSSLSRMSINGRTAAARELHRSQSGCTHPQVVVSRYTSGSNSYVKLHVSCVMQTIDLGLLRLPSKFVTATSTEVIDVYTHR